MNKETFLTLVKNKDYGLMLFTFVNEISPVPIPQEQFHMFVRGLSLYFGKSDQQLLSDVMTHYEKKFHIEIWRDKTGKTLHYAGERVL